VHILEGSHNTTRAAQHLVFNTVEVEEQVRIRRWNSKDTDSSPNKRKEILLDQATTSVDPGSATADTYARKECSMTFPRKLMRVLESQEFGDAIWWNSDGDAFCIDPKEFAEKVIEKHFQGTKFSSFTRKLKRWGFTRIDDGCFGAVLYRHDMFRRGNPDLPTNMRIMKKKERDSWKELMWQERLSRDLATIDQVPNYQKEEGSRESTSFLSSPPMRLRNNTFLLPELARHQLMLQSNFERSQNTLVDSNILSSTLLAHSAVNDYQTFDEVAFQGRLGKMTTPSSTLCAGLFRNVLDSSTAPSSFMGNRALTIQQKEGEVKTSAYTLAKHQLSRLQAQQEAISLATTRRIRMLQNQEEQFAGVARFSHLPQTSSAVLASRILQTSSQWPPHHEESLLSLRSRLASEVMAMTLRQEQQQQQRNDGQLSKRGLL
jgi:hypothetical protein